MKISDIKAEEDMLDYLEGVLNDFEQGICDMKETQNELMNYTSFVLRLAFMKSLKMTGEEIGETIIKLKEIYEQP